MDITAELANGHGYLGYAVFAVVLFSVVWAFVQKGKGAEYKDGTAKLAGLLLPLQLLYGIVVFVQGRYWEGSALIAIVHPLAMLGAVALAGISTARARKAEGDAASWAAIAKFQGIALVLVIIGIGAASAG